jgi:hypothetical protein
VNATANPAKPDRHSTMHFHQTWMRHAAIGIGAAAMTAITFGAFVIAPATMGANDVEPRLLAASTATVLASARAATTIDVDAIHERRLDTVQCPEPNHVRPYRMPQD